MPDLLLRIHATVRSFFLNEQAQDLAEYAMTVALIALGSVAGMESLASGVTLAFNDVSSSLNSALLQ